jgi:hypothetical protein
VYVLIRASKRKTMKNAGNGSLSKFRGSELLIRELLRHVITFDLVARVGISLDSGLVKRKLWVDHALFRKTPPEVAEHLVRHLESPPAVAGIVDAVHEVLIQAGIPGPISLEVVQVVSTDPCGGQFRSAELVEPRLSSLILGLGL